MTMPNNSESVMTSMGDVFSLSVLLGYFLAGLPTIALLLTISWTVIRIYESYLNVRKLRREERKPNEPII